MFFFKLASEFLTNMFYYNLFIIENLQIYNSNIIFLACYFYIYIVFCL